MCCGVSCCASREQQFLMGGDVARALDSVYNIVIVAYILILIGLLMRWAPCACRLVKHRQMGHHDCFVFEASRRAGGGGLLRDALRPIGVDGGHVFSSSSAQFDSEPSQTGSGLFSGFSRALSKVMVHAVCCKVGALT